MTSFGLRPFGRLVLAALVPTACLVDSNLGDTEGDTSTGSTGPSASTSGSPSTTTSDPSGDDASGATTGTATDGSDDSSGGPVVECPPQPGQMQCDVLAQDCPGGLRCVAFGDDLGATTVCVPEAEAPLERYAPCTIDPSGCTDPCAAGDYCLPTDASDSGLCVAPCSAFGDDETCDAGALCGSCEKCSSGVCWAACDPLAPACPGGAPTCVPSPADGAFQCFPFPEGNAGAGEACIDTYACAPGLACIDDAIFGGCDGDGGCCSELCDLADGEPGCTDPDLTCLPFFFPGPAPAGQAHVGVCGLPEFDPCNVPGNCPPDGIDDSIPWCSLANESWCPKSVPAGFFDGIACEQTCTCGLPCDGPEMCPVPATGTATAECVVEPDGPGSRTTCLYSCAAGEICPDGMTCTDQLYGEPYCLWVSPADPDECL